MTCTDPRLEAMRRHRTTRELTTREIVKTSDRDLIESMMELSARVKALEGRNTDVAGLLQAVQTVIGEHVAHEVSEAETRLKKAIADYLVDVGHEAERVLKGAA